MHLLDKDSEMIRRAARRRTCHSCFLKPFCNLFRWPFRATAPGLSNKLPTASRGLRRDVVAGYAFAACLRKDSMMEERPPSNALCLPLTLLATAIEALQPHHCPAGAVKAAEVLVGSWEIRNLHLLSVPG